MNGTKRIAFLTMAETDGHAIDDDLVVAPARELGLEIECVAWDRKGVDWGSYELVVVRSTWDYMERSAEFLETLEVIQRTAGKLENDLELMRWNLDKRYLCDLAERGVPTIPTLWRDRLAPGELSSLLDELGTESMVVKQVVGAGAIGSWYVTRSDIGGLRAEVEAHYRDRALMAQAFVESVRTEGEYSLIFIGGELSHTLLKTPKHGDYRSQEEYGSRLQRVDAEADLRLAAERVLRGLLAAPLYARVDLLRADDGNGFQLIELELVEPSLYLRIDPEAPSRMARALFQLV